MHVDAFKFNDHLLKILMLQKHLNLMTLDILRKINKS